MTAQVYEKIRYQGKRMRLASCPHFPEDNPRILKLSDNDFLDGDYHNEIGSTACWREYIGSWSIRRGKLYLTKIEGRFRLDGKGALFAEWVTGELCIPRGKMIQYVHAGFKSVYEEELILTLKQGVVINTEVVTPNRGIGLSDLIDRVDD